jgi:hypothetical protein
LPRRHMWGVFYRSYIGFSWLHIVIAWQSLPSAFAFFFYSPKINLKKDLIDLNQWTDRPVKLQMTRQTSYITTFFVLLFLHPHREASALANEIPEGSGQFRFLFHTTWFVI